MSRARVLGTGFTVTRQTAFRPLSCVTVIFAVPSFTAVILPLCVTLTTEELLVFGSSSKFEIKGILKIHFIGGFVELDGIGEEVHLCI